MYIYICIYTHPHMVAPSPHELPTLVLHRKCRVKPAIPAGPDPVSVNVCQSKNHFSRERAMRLDMSTHITSTLS